MTPSRRTFVRAGLLTTPHTPRPAEAATIQGARRRGFAWRRAAVSTRGRGPGGPLASGRRSASWDRRRRRLGSDASGARRVRGSGVPSGALGRPRRDAAPPVPRAVTCSTSPRSRSQVSTTRATRGSRSSSWASLDHPPVSHQKARPSHRYQSGRTIGPVRPIVATRATSGWARNPSRSKPSSTVQVVLAPPSATRR